LTKTPDPKEFELIYLADAPKYIDTCAAWHFTAWGVKSDQRTLKKDIEKFKKSAHKNKLPLTILYKHKTRNVPVAMGSIWFDDSDYWSRLNPWISCIFVHEDFRKRSLATSIVQHLEKIAADLNVDKIYLTASAATGMYEKMDYTAEAMRDAPETPTGQQTLFSKVLKQ
jgi:GNAT superfamily N-acetyltransferase